MHEMLSAPENAPDDLWATGRGYYTRFQTTYLGFLQKSLSLPCAQGQPLWGKRWCFPGESACAL